MKTHPIELLSPAGSFESLQAAIHAGADAIYFGVEQLNMRTRSVNTFTIEDIKKISTVCKKAGIRSYITLNTVMYDHDMQLLQRILKEIKKCKIDAVIAADFAVMEYCRQMNIPVHISTQANVSNIESVQFFSQYADVVVLARELTLQQIKQITREIKRRKIKGVSGELIKIEVFVHGALCMAISGKCYLSLHTQHASANRGACVQNCRRSYTVRDTETNEELIVDNEYIMSPQDLCTINILDQIIETGVDVLKIEGRSKGPDYVYETTACYKEAIVSIQKDNFTVDKIAGWYERLKKVYNRGFWEGYFLGRELGQWTKDPGSIATEKKIYLGKAVHYYPKIKVGEFLLESGQVEAGETLMVTGPSFGMEKIRLQELVVNGVKSKRGVKGDKLTFPLQAKISQLDKLYKIVPSNNG